jgi:RNA polymerase sigma-70 factor, ECF subfamily
MSKPIDNNEQAFISEVLNGEVEAYRYLVDRYLKGLLSHLYNLLGDRDLAEDVTQDAFLKAYQKLGQYKSQYAFSTWLYAIADNLAYKQMKRSRRFTSFDEVEDFIADSHDSAADRIDRAHQQLKVRQAIQKLDPHYRQVISLYYWENRSYEEIAYILKRPIGTIRTWLRRSKDELREELYEQTR